MRIPAIIQDNKMLVILTALISIGVLMFDIFYYSSAYGIVEINYINSLFLVPFIALVCFLGFLLGNSKQQTEFDIAYQNRITGREKEVITLILKGKKNKEISNELFVELSTIKSHINNIYKKTGAKNRKELLKIAQSVLEKD